MSFGGSWPEDITTVEANDQGHQVRTPQSFRQRLQPRFHASRCHGIAQRRADSVVAAAMSRDVSVLFMEQLMLYRDTRDSILAGTKPWAWAELSPAGRERALQTVRAAFFGSTVTSDRPE